jgi:hypothetical protein
MNNQDQLVSIISESCPKHSSVVNAKQRICTVRTVTSDIMGRGRLANIMKKCQVISIKYC